MPHLIYVAGPYTNPDPTENTRKAIAAGEELHKAGFVPFIPHLTHLWEFYHKHPYQEWLDYDMHWLRKCDAVLRIPGESNGADKEEVEAKRIGIPVFYNMDDLRAWTYVPDEDRKPDPNPADVAKSLVYGDRNRDYGHPLDDFSKTALIWSAVLGTNVSAEQVALCMCGVKISRQVHRPKDDNLVDLIGYTLTLHEVIKERERRDEVNADHLYTRPYDGKKFVPLETYNRIKALAEQSETHPDWPTTHDQAAA